MAAIKTVTLLVFLLALPITFAVPSLPTLVYGKVFGPGNTPLPDIEAKATFFDESGQEHTLRAATDKDGNYYFTDGYLLAPSGSLITITSGNSKTTVLGNPGTTIQAKAIILSAPPQPLTAEEKEEIAQSKAQNTGSAAKGSSTGTTTGSASGSGQGGAGSGGTGSNARTGTATGQTGSGTGGGNGGGSGSDGTDSSTGTGGGGTGNGTGSGTAANYTKLPKSTMNQLKQLFRKGKPLETQPQGAVQPQQDDTKLSSLAQRILQSLSKLTKPTEGSHGNATNTFNNATSGQKAEQTAIMENKEVQSNTTTTLSAIPQQKQEETAAEKAEKNLQTTLETYFYSDGKPRYDRMILPFIVLLGIIFLIGFAIYTSVRRLNKMRDSLAIKGLRKKIIKILNIPLSDIMTEKLITTEESTPMTEIMGIFTANNTGSVLVTDGKKLRGIITERDILKRIEDKNLHLLRAQDIMTKDPTSSTPKTRLGEAGLHMIKQSVRKLPILQHERLVGIVTMTDLLKKYHEFFNRHEFESENIPSVQSYLSHNYIQAQPSEPVLDALNALITKKANSILCTIHNEPIGIITERDLLSEYSLNPNFLKQTTVQALMKASVIKVQSYATIIEANNIMIAHNIRRLPVVQGDEVVGFITQSDLLEAFCTFMAFITSEEGKKAISTAE